MTAPVPADAVAAAIPIVVSLHDVSHFYGHTRALDNLSLDVPAGCMVGLLGPDGVGKSTTFDLISGARKIQTGTVEVLGGDMRDARHRRLISWEFPRLCRGGSSSLTFPTVAAERG